MTALPILLACQAGTGVGLGHLSRLLVAAQALQALPGARLQLLVQAEPLQRADLQALPHQVIPPGDDLCAALAAQVQAHQASTIVLDLQPQRVPAGLPALLAQWRQQGRRVVAIDGLLALRHGLDLVFMPSFRNPLPATGGNTNDSANAIDSASDTASQEAGAPLAPVRFGWDCFLLDTRLSPRPWTPGAQVLALTGGSDATGLGRHWPTLLDAALPAGTRLHWVVGPYAAAPQWPASPRLAWQPHQAPAGLGPLMQASHYAVTVFGVSCFELLRLGVPTVAFSPYGQKDTAELAELAAQGLLLQAHDEQHATTLLAGLMTQPAQAQALSQRARQRLAVPGAHTLAAAVQALHTSAPLP